MIYSIFIISSKKKNKLIKTISYLPVQLFSSGLRVIQNVCKEFYLKNIVFRHFFHSKHSVLFSNLVRPYLIYPYYLVVFVVH